MLAATAAIVVLVLIWLITIATQRSRTGRLLSALWSSYKQTVWISAEGRTADEQNHAVTTSEGQSYTLLRAVWANDRPTFDATWRWTAANLQRPDKLFSWRWGLRPDGTSGVLTAQGGRATASDADADIALALLMADARWHERAYADAAQAIIPSIWEHEVVTVNDRRYMAADDIEKDAATPWFIVNPSYLAPYAYRTFAAVDTHHNWIALARDTYTTLQQAGFATVGGQTGCGLPPDWMAVDRHSGAITASPSANQNQDFGFNALRIPWRIALDWQWYHEPEAKRALQQFQFLNDEWQRHGKILALYTHSCQPAADYTSYAMYGGVLGYFYTIHRPEARAIVRSQLNPLLDTRTGGLTQHLRYYDNNWVWFGLALQAGRLTNLAGKGVPP